MEKNDNVVRIRTMKGMILTLSDSVKTSSHIEGYDKFGKYYILPLCDVDKMTPYEVDF